MLKILSSEISRYKLIMFLLESMKSSMKNQESKQSFRDKGTEARNFKVSFKTNRKLPDRSLRKFRTNKSET